MFLPLLATVCLAGPPTAEPAPRLSRRARISARWNGHPRFHVWLGPRGAMRLGGGVAGGGAGAVGVAARIVWGLGAFVDLAEGVYAAPNQVVGEIRFGLRYAFGQGRWQPAVLLGVDHGHEQDFADFAREPGASLVGSSDAIEHRTGPMAGVELRYWLSPDPRRRVLHHMAVLGRIDATYYVDEAPLPARLAFGLGFSAVF